MILYELINPSDMYTFEAPSLLIAACAVLILGEGKYGADPVVDTEHTRPSDPERVRSSDPNRVPIFLFGGHDAWLKEHGVDDLSAYIDEHRSEIATCLDSFLIGSYAQRQTMEKVLAEIRDAGDRERARDKWLDERRSSMNNIGDYAKRLAASLRKPKNTDESAAQP